MEAVKSVNSFNIKQTKPYKSPNILFLTGEELYISNCAYGLLKDEGQVCRAVLILCMNVRVYIGVWYICRHMRALQCIVRRAGGIGLLRRLY